VGKIAFESDANILAGVGDFTHPTGLAGVFRPAFCRAVPYDAEPPRSPVPFFRDPSPQADAQRFNVMERVRPRADGGMGHQDDVAAAILQQRLRRVGRLAIEDIKAKPAEAAGGERLKEGMAVDQLGAGDIDHNGAGLHAGKLIAPDQSAR
jgi:hypothetical protein